MENVNKSCFRAFTLIELLVVVLIIGVLTAIAIPQYQTAVQKSKYATLMPLAKSVKNAEEGILMSNGSYTEELTELDVNVPAGDVSITAKAGDNESYVRASKTGLNNRLVMYMAKSSRYPNEIHCEAEQDNKIAKQICLSYGGSQTPVAGTADSTGYDTYVIEGSGTDAGAISKTGTPLSVVSSVLEDMTAFIQTEEAGSLPKNDSVPYPYLNLGEDFVCDNEGTCVKEDLEYTFTCMKDPSGRICTVNISPQNDSDLFCSFGTGYYNGSIVSSPEGGCSYQGAPRDDGEEYVASFCEIFGVEGEACSYSPTIINSNK